MMVTSLFRAEEVPDSDEILPRMYALCMLNLTSWVKSHSVDVMRKSSTERCRFSWCPEVEQTDAFAGQCHSAAVTVHLDANETSCYGNRLPQPAKFTSVAAKVIPNRAVHGPFSYA
ncbi:hypothetical protein AVEN_34679-1 [Araneus ventricosus]|uniref:Uncharacterized protein n=1 Tax=Araneus ventricosus TaxID=182803 RepID=A0A4Y2B071_ARAVE|nr:hypothetical protein AVEN_34679-1 [Araneus ventricosus]